jgi:hypothetical protein
VDIFRKVDTTSTIGRLRDALMKALLAFTVLVLSPVIAAAAVAQDSAAPPVPPPNRPRVSVDELLNGRPATASFDALQAILDSGYEIVVTDDVGRVRRGRVASISRDRLVMASPVAAGSWEALLPLYPPLDGGVVLKRRIFRSAERVFVEGTIRRIDIVDSTRNGTTIGAAVGVGLVAGVYQWERRQPDGNLKGLLTSVAVLLGLPISLRMGHVLDRAINDSIYERDPTRPQVTVGPLLGRGAIGASAQVRF